MTLTKTIEALIKDKRISINTRNKVQELYKEYTLLLACKDSHKCHHDIHLDNDEYFRFYNNQNELLYVCNEYTHEKHESAMDNNHLSIILHKRIIDINHNHEICHDKQETKINNLQKANERLTIQIQERINKYNKIKNLYEKSLKENTSNKNVNEKINHYRQQMENNNIKHNSMKISYKSTISQLNHDIINIKKAMEEQETKHNEERATSSNIIIKYQNEEQILINYQNITDFMNDTVHERLGISGRYSIFDFLELSGVEQYLRNEFNLTKTEFLNEVNKIRLKRHEIAHPKVDYDIDIIKSILTSA